MLLGKTGGKVRNLSLRVSFLKSQSIYHGKNLFNDQVDKIELIGGIDK